MATMLDRLLAQDISDPSDFPDDATTPGLRAFDDALRCSICRDFYDAPVSLNCGHTFCSACIRSSLPEQSQCPACRKPASEVHLRKNAVVENVVYAWNAARPLILRYAQEEQRRKTHPDPPTHPPPNPPGHGNKRKRRDSPPPAQAASSDIEILSSPSPSSSSTPDGVSASASASISMPDLVACPICQKDVPSGSINMHIDSGCRRYLSEGSTSSTAAPDPANAHANAKSKQKQQWSMLLAGGGAVGGSAPAKGKGKARGKSRTSPDPPSSDPDAPAHLPKVAYDIHPQKRIAEMLAEWGLPAHGDKPALARRHARWVVLYNANADRGPRQRRTLEQLRAELRRAEEAEARGRRAAGAGSGAGEDAVAYQRANKAAFARLTEAARPRKPRLASAGEGQDGQTERAREVIDVDVDADVRKR